MEFDFKLEPGRGLHRNRVADKDEALVSIITPYYNAGKYFMQTVNCVFNQTFPYYEWIIVNDGSTKQEDIDLLLKVAEEDNRIRVYLKENGGIASARNMGIKHSKTDIIIILDSDDLIDPTYVECVYWSLYANPDASWSYTDSVGFYGQEYLWKKPFSVKMMKKDNILTCTAGIRKEALNEVGLYSEVRKHYNEDWALWLKLLSKGRYPVHMGWYGFWYRRSDSGVLGAIKGNKNEQTEALRIIRDLGKDVKNDVKAIEYPRYINMDFSSPNKWDWNKKLVSDDKKINILMMIPHMEMGGADLFNLDIVSRMPRDKYNISIIATNPGKSTWRQRFEEYVTDIFDLTKFLDMKDWSAFIHYFIKSRRIDMLLISNSYFGYYLVPWLRREFPDLVIVDYIHMEEWHFRAGGYARASGIADDILERTYVCNEHLKGVLIKSFHKDAEKIETLYIGVDENRFSRDRYQIGSARKELGISMDRPVVLYPCRIDVQKRPFLMVEIAKETKKRIPDICYIVIGDGPQFKELKRYINKERLEETIYLIGRRKEMGSYYRDSDVTLICSENEGLALTAYESLSMGVPVVSSDVGGQKELIDETVGKLIPVEMSYETGHDNRNYTAEEIARYADAIVELIENRDKKENIIACCREKINKQFTKDKMIEKLDNEFREFKAGHGKEKRQMVFEAVNLLSNFVNDYTNQYFRFEINSIQSGRAVKIYNYLRDLLKFKKSPGSIFTDINSIKDKYFIERYMSIMKDSLIGRTGRRIKRLLRG